MCSFFALKAGNNLYPFLRFKGFFRFIACRQGGFAFCGRDASKGLVARRACTNGRHIG